MKSPLLAYLLLGIGSYHVSDALVAPHPLVSSHQLNKPLQSPCHSSDYAESESDISITVSRSNALQQLLLSSAALLFPTSALAMYENAPIRNTDDVVTSGPTTLPSGVSYEDLRPGTGDIVTEGKRVNIQWVLKRSNGYFIDSSEQNDGVPFIFTVGGTTTTPRAITGLDEGIRGMRVNGIRRIIIPPELSYVEGVEDGKPGPVPQGFGPKQRIRRVMTLLKDVPGESILLDVKATRVQ